jgi:putative ABC transport system permease protein
LNISETAGAAFASLKANRLRSVLTSVGVTIGVTAVVTLVGLVTGLQNYIKNQFDAVLGASVFEISRFSSGFDDRESWIESRRWPPLTAGNAIELSRLMTTAQGVTWRAGSSGTVSMGSRSATDVRIRGLAPTELDVASMSLASGRFFSATEDNSRSRICVLGNDLARTLGNPASMLGEPVTVGGERFTVIGVAKPLGSIFGHGLDNFVAIPYSTFAALFPEESDDDVEIAVLPLSSVSMAESQEEARLLLRRMRQVPFSGRDNFYITTQEGILKSMEQVTTGAAIVTIGVAAISLLVGGIGIMNIMLVSVTERTREIGTRRAIGARRKDIVMQFLVEAVTISLIGGMVGLLLGFTAIILAGKLTPVPAAVSPFAAILAIAFSTSVGLAFGIYPAWKAARLDPVEALRYE